MTEWNETAPGTKRQVLGRTPLTAYLRDTHAVRVIGMEGGLLKTETELTQNQVESEE